MIVMYFKKKGERKKSIRGKFKSWDDARKAMEVLNDLNFDKFKHKDGAKIYIQEVS